MSIKQANTYLCLLLGIAIMVAQEKEQTLMLAVRWMT